MPLVICGLGLDAHTQIKNQGLVCCCFKFLYCGIPNIDFYVHRILLLGGDKDRYVVK